VDRIAPFDSQQLEAACKVLADTERGLKGSEIGYLLQDCKVPDVSPGMTKWKRLFNALAGVQNKHHVGNHLIMFINRALNPVSYARDRSKFEWRRSELNVVLAFAGFEVRDDGKVVRTSAATTISAARAKANALRARLEDRNAHEKVFEFCRAELLDENYFHAVLEAVKGVAERVRELSGLTTDGADLFNEAFSTKRPILAVNELITDTDRSEQKGLTNMLVGLFGAVRNPTAHAPKVRWEMTEQDALDILSLVSFVHRKLDVARKV
jgi:uncharacterized protein (TIGR02391 family)